MKFTQTWTASSNDLEKQKEEGLENIVGKWGSQIEVTISNPAIMTPGPIEIHTEQQEVPNR